MLDTIVKWNENRVEHDVEGRGIITIVLVGVI